MAKKHDAKASEIRKEDARAREATAGLVPLSGVSDLEVDEGNEDVRGWTVAANDGTPIGSVQDLLVDPKAMKVRYLDVALDRGLFPAGRRALVPVGATRTDDHDNVVRADVSVKSLGAYPEYRGGAVTRDYETSVRSALGGTTGTGRAAAAVPPAARAVVEGDDDFYNDAHYDEAGLRARRRQHQQQQQQLANEGEARLTLSEEHLEVGKRRVASEAYLRKRVVTERVRQTVPVQYEEITIERRPLPAGASAEVQITEDEIRIPLMREEVVLEKRAVPVEEVVVGKKVVTQNQTVEADLRREKLDESSLNRGNSPDRGGR